MTVKEKVELAQKGTKEERRILIADVNKIVSMAVLKCESIGMAEVESFCAMRHLHTEIFQEIALDPGMDQAAEDPVRPGHQPRGSA